VVSEPLFGISGFGFPVLVDDALIFPILYHVGDNYSSQAKYDVMCLNAQTGSLIWKREGINPSTAQGLVYFIPDWLLYYANKMYLSLGGCVICVDGESWDPLWEYRLSEGKDVVLSANCGMLVATGGSWTYCLDAETGKELWKTPVKGFFTEAAITREDVFVGSDDGNLYRLDLQSGSIKGRYYLGGVVFSPVVAQGHVLVGTSEDMLYCLGPARPSYITGIAVGIVLLMGILVLYILKRSKSNLLQETAGGKTESNLTELNLTGDYINGYGDKDF
jgi:outer membrane protein assembly factor BamB